MAIARPDYACPNCGHCPTELEISRSHFTHKCPACDGPLTLDAPGALTRSRGAAMAGIAGMVLGVIAGIGALAALGVTESMIAGWPQALRLGMGIAICVVGTAVAFSCQRAWVKHMLARVSKQMKKDGEL